MKPSYGVGALCLALVALAGCRHTTPRPVAASLVAASAAPKLPLLTNAPLVLNPDRDHLTTLLLARLRKRVLGRREGLRDLDRIVREIAPLVAVSTHQPEAEAVLAEMAVDEGVSQEEMRSRWTALQEADLLLESGGDPDGISPAHAVGVAQWLAGTGSAQGLHINLKESERLTGKIMELRRQIAWRTYLQRPDADPSAPGAPKVTPAEAAAQLPALRGELEMLRAKRRNVDARFEPQKAIFAQTRYLLRLYRRFPSPDWLFQAYHGGEGGVERLLRLYLGHAWPGSAAAAIRSGQAGRSLRFEDLYFSATPRAHAEAFFYLYGRGDDHRHYWWKLRTSEAILALYRRDPAAVQREWESYLPGRPMDAVWYPDAPAESLADLPALQATGSSHQLVPVPARASWRLRPAALDPPHARWYAALRPQALGALLLVAAVFRHAGGSAPLPIGDLTLTQQYVAQARALHPPKPPKPPFWPPDPDAHLLIGGGPPFDFDFHTAGIAFDLLRSPDEKQRKILEYALGSLEDRQILSVVDAKDRDERRFHIVPNPRFGDALARIAQTGQLPAM